MGCGWFGVRQFLGVRIFLHFAALSSRICVLILFISYLVCHSGYDNATSKGVTCLPYANAESLKNGSHVCKLPHLLLVLLYFHLLVGASRFVHLHIY